MPDCIDKSDENNCELIVVENSYNKMIPPITRVSVKNSTVVPAHVNISISLLKVVAIEELDHIIALKFNIELEWLEVRATYHNLKLKTELNVITEIDQMWLPYVIYDNTDMVEAVQLLDYVDTRITVERQQEQPERSKTDVVDEIEIFKGMF